MAKKTSKQSETAKAPNSIASVFGAVVEKAVDPNLASLFASSLGPVERPPKSRYQASVRRPAKNEDDEELSSADSDEDVEMESGSDEEGSESDQDEEESSKAAESDESDSEQSQSENEKVLAEMQQSVLQGDAGREQKKRKRGNKEEDLEDTYMKKLAREEAREEELRLKKQKLEAKQKKEAAESDSDESGSENGGSEGSDNGEEVQEDDYIPPKHETEQDDSLDDVERAARTVFLGNVSNSAITSKSDKKTLMKHLSSFIPDLPDNNPPHKVESLRFRSTAFANALPKKAAFVKKDVMDATTKSTNAYVVYTTQTAAREAVKRLNGTIVLNRHLRVDSVAHPMKVDNRRCVFVGNLGFVDDESSLKTDDDDKKKKNKTPGDVEEGLWVHFSKAGKVESVRVVRDPKTRVGKGFAYVQFEDENGVEAALQFHDQKFPPLLPRKLRVVRAKGIKRNASKQQPQFQPKTNKNSVYNAKVSNEQKSMQGRAQKLLGRAGAFRTAESFVFEGHRAKPGADRPASKKKRKTSRSAAWKAAGGKKPAK